MREDGGIMLTGVLTMTGAVSALYYFVRGRAVCPPLERLPLEELDGTGILHAIGRGWAAPDIRWD